METKIIQVGNSKGIRLPKQLIAKYGLAEVVVIKELKNGILIEASADSQLSWDETYKAMAQSEEDWSDWAEMDLEDMHED